MKTLNLNQMENVQGGADILRDKGACEEASLGIKGAGTILSAGGVFSGGSLAVAGILTLFAGELLSSHCNTLR
ncbi:MAG: hypothetical protein Q4A09_07515 [Capnocytophaga felis]|nr:hypothetical protein [Capnocytophaga felis]